MLSTHVLSFEQSYVVAYFRQMAIITPYAHFKLNFNSQNPRSVDPSFSDVDAQQQFSQPRLQSAHRRHATMPKECQTSSALTGQHDAARAADGARLMIASWS